MLRLLEVVFFRVQVSTYRTGGALRTTSIISLTLTNFKSVADGFKAELSLLRPAGRIERLP